MAESLSAAPQEVLASPELAQTTIGEIEELAIMFRNGHSAQIGADGWRILEEFGDWLRSRTERSEN